MKHYKFAFTMAEILITIGVIGVVASMTIPSVIKNYERERNLSKLKKAYAQLSQAIYSASESNDIYSLGDNWNDATEVINVLKNYLKVSKIYSSKSTTTAMCYNKGNITPYNHYWQYNWEKNNGGQITSPFDSNVKSMELVDGTCIGFAYGGNDRYIFVDTNGSNNLPNIAGRDLFFFRLTSKNKIYGAGYNLSNNQIQTGCAGKSSTRATGNYCAERIMRDGWQIKYY
jgi:type II secretory pathway pseudopilin PulG